MQKNIVSDDVLNRDYLQKLDREVKLLPLTFDPVFKGIFGTNLELLKDFLLSVNLNTKDKAEKNGEHIIVPFDMSIGEVYLRNSVTVLKYLEFYLY